jgi:hypothetical protein
MKNHAIITLARSRLAFLSVFLLLLCSSLSAQVSGGTLSGTVSDPSGAVIPNARVAVTNTGTGIVRSTTTNDAGFYTAPNLNPGNYEVSVEAQGFSKTTEATLISVGQQAELNVHLGLAAAENTVQVQDNVQQVELATSTLSATVGGQAVREIPLNGRDWTSLAQLEPNVHSVDTQFSIQAGNNSRANRGWGTQLMIAGNRPQQNNYRLDGVTLNDYSGSGPGSVLGGALGVDAIQEFSVVTGNADAQYGRQSGGVINAVTRSGNNSLHGSVYEFLRNSALDTRNYFDGNSVPPFKRNQFGASLGGPIYKNRTFFFFDYEGLRQGLSTTTIDTVPSAAARSGNLTAGKVTVDPKVVPYLALFPLPNGATIGDFGSYSFVGKSVTNEDLYTGRIDHTFSDRDSINGTVLSDDSSNSQPDTYNFTLLGMVVNRKLVAAQESHIFGPSLANFARIGYSRTVSLAPDTAGAINPAANDTSLGFAPGSTVGEMRISGITIFPGGVGAEGTYQYHYNSYQVYDDLFWTHGAHSIKFGGAFERDQSNEFGSTTTGSFVFGNLKNFLTNAPTSFSSAVPGAAIPIYLRQSVGGAYAQDDWHLRQNLTVNLGLRYELASVPTEINNHLTTLPSLTAPQPKIGSPYYNNPTKLDFSPRVGVSWDPFGDGKTAVRAGFGIYDTLPLIYQFELLSLNAAPYSLNVSLPKAPKGSFPSTAYSLANGVTGTGLRYAYVQQDPGRMYVEQWNFNIQRQLPGQNTIEVGYIGSHGVHQPFRSNDSNIVLPTDTQNFIWPSTAGTKINPVVGNIDTLAWNVSPLYDAATARFTRQQKGLRYGLSYTWAKSLDETSGSVGGSTYVNSITAPFVQFPNRFKGLSDFDVRHNFVANALWQLPGPANGLAGKVAGGWELGTIFFVRSGLAFSPLVGGDPLGLQNNNPFSFPNYVSGCNPISGNPAQYINTSCFTFAGKQLGNAGRNSLTGPGLTDLDFSLIKNTHVTERLNLQFRAEAFNLLNHANFATPDRVTAQIFDATGAVVPTAGQLKATSTSSRQLQFALKVLF